MTQLADKDNSKREEPALERDRLEPHRFTVSEYHAMSEAGVFPDGTRTELLAGEIYFMPPMGEEHYGILAKLTNELAHKLYGKAVIVCQVPVELNDTTEPEPDFIVLQFRDDYYRKRKGKREDAHAFIEVSKSTLDHDRHRKLPWYAQAGIPEVWIVNATKEKYELEVYREPQDGVYRTKLTFDEGQAAALLEFENIRIEWW